MARKVIGLARNVVGQKGSTRRRWALLATLAMVVSGIVYIQAVHRDGVFELDGNVASTSDAGLNCATIPADLGCGIDWENVAKGTLPAGVSSTGIVGDAPLAKGGDQSIFTTGGAKDDLDTTNWLWTTGSVPDKDEILDAYAVRIGNTIYFGADRFITNGTAQMGFWFFQNSVGPITEPDGDRTFGTAGHKVGDVLVLADFTNGGAAVTVRIYKWVGTGGDTNGTLQLILPLPDPGGGDPDPADCRDGTLGSGDDFCGTTNPAVINLLTGQTPASATPLWPYQAKSGAANLIPIGGFLEGGIDLTALNLGGQCFASFLAETRSSAEPGAQLKDFVHHSFQPCNTGTVTTPSDAAGNPLAIDSDKDGLKEVFPGASVTDHALVSGTGGSVAPLGKVVFHICSPTELTAGVCSTGGSLVGPATGKDLVAIASTTTSQVTSDTFAIPNLLSSIGTWCWRGDYLGNPQQGYPASSDSSIGECFEVVQLQPTITTAQTWTVTDSATITVAAGAGNLTGSLKFELWQNDTNCEVGGGTPVQTTTIAISAASPQTKVSDTFQIALPGPKTYSWKVTYTSTNAGHKDVSSACNVEGASLNFTNDPNTP